MKFSFPTTPETNEFCTVVVKCLVKYGNKSEEEALNLVNSFWEKAGEFTVDDYRLHEDPYYWAMCIFHDRQIGDNRPEWWKDPTLWPPPKEFLEYWHNHGKPPW